MINLFTLLANPISGNGRSLRALPEIERVMKDFSLDYHVEYTREPGDATSIAEKAVQNKEDGIVVIGIADRVGSLEVGKDADIAIADGCPFEIATRMKYVFIDGVNVLENA